MSDLSDTSSSSEEWERMSEYDGRSELRKLVQIMQEMERRITNLEDEKRQCREEMRKRDEETRKRDVKLEAMEEENAKLKLMIEESQVTFTMDMWMKEQAGRMNLSNKILSEKTLEVYKLIWQTGVTKQQTTSSVERKKLSEQIQKLEDLSEKISRDVMLSNEKHIQDIQIAVNSTEETTQLKNEMRAIDDFLGVYAVAEPNDNYPVPFIIRKSIKDGFYQVSWTYNDRSTAKWTFVPDNVERDRIQAHVEKNILSIRVRAHTKQFELCNNGLMYKYVRFNRI